MTPCAGRVRGLLALALFGLAATVFAVDPTWTQKAWMPTSRDGLAAAMLGGNVYAIGGEDGLGLAYGTVEIYDPSSDAWSTGPAMPTPRFLLAAVAAGGTIYAIGGTNGTDLSTVEAYDPATASWGAKAGLTTARRGLAAAAVGGTIYAIGGVNGGGIVAAVEAYDPDTDSWVTKAPLPVPMEFLAAATVGGTVYVLGGFDGASYSAAVWAYDPATDSWSGKAAMAIPRGNLAAAAVGGTVYAVGGSNGSDLTSVEGYFTRTDAWVPKSPMTVPRNSLAAAVVGGTMYAIGGNEGGATAMVEAGLVVPALPPAQLSATLMCSPGAAPIGTTVTVQLTVTNTGGEAADGVAPSLQINQGAGLVLPVGTVVPSGTVLLAPGGAQTFVWTFSVTGVGIVGLTGTATGQDAVTSGAIAGSGSGSFAGVNSTLSVVSIQAAPTLLEIDQVVTVVMTVSATGALPVFAISPTGLAPTGPGQVAYETGPVPPSITRLDPGQSGVFTWTWRTVRGGTVTFVGGASAVGSPPATPAGSNLVVIYDGASDLTHLEFYPTPFRPDLAVGGTLKFRRMVPGTHVRIYDAAGGLVRDLESDAFGYAEWDARNGAGRRAAGGVYFFAAVSPSGEKKLGKFELVH